VLNAWFTRYQTLNDAWSVKLSGASQTASRPLFTSQQFYLGGTAFGRGYGAAEISGDNGLAGSFELRFDQKINFRYWSGYQLYSFADAGVVWNDGYRLSDGLSLTSAGAGIRLFLWDDLQADFGVALPLSYRAPDNGRRSARFLFTLSRLQTLPRARQGELPLVPRLFHARISFALRSQRACLNLIPRLPHNPSIREFPIIIFSEK